jgi:antitoxin PrlF
MIISKLTSKAQTTIPQAVRTALHLHAGDAIAYAIEDARVIITNARSSDPFNTFTEWDSEADHRAYDGL